MTLKHRKGVRIILFITAIITFIIAGFIIADAFLGSLNNHSVISIIAGSYFALLGLLILFLLIRTKKRNKVNPKGYVITLFFLLVIFFVVGVFYALNVPSWADSWIYYAILISLSTFFLFDIFAVIILSRLCKKSKEYVPYRLLSHFYWFLIDTAFVVIFFYAIVIPKSLLLTDIWNTIQGNNSLPVGPLIGVIAFALVNIVVSLHQLYICCVSLVTYKERQPLKLINNAKYTIGLFKKHEMSFYFGIFANIIMFSIALVSCISFFFEYISLVALYAMVILIRIPLFYHNRYISKKYKDNPALLFKKKHDLNTYFAILYFIYSAVIIIYGSSSMTKAVAKSMNYLMLIFVPYAIIKLVLAILKFRKARKTADPSLTNTVNVNFALVFFTFTNALFMLAVSLSNRTFLIIGAIISLCFIAFCVQIGLLAIIAQILAYKDKRKKKKAKFIKVYNENKEKVLKNSK